MKKERRYASTRYRAVVSSILLGSVFFFILSPLVQVVIAFIFPPNSPRNVEVVEKNREADIRWDNSSIDPDVRGFRIIVNNSQEFNLDVSVDSYIISNLDNDTRYEIDFYTVDNTNRTSPALSFEITPSGNRTNSFTLNPYNQFEVTQSAVLWISIVIAFLGFVLTQWILFFKLKGMALFTIGLYPSLSLLPFTLLVSSLYFSINSQFNQTIFVLGVSLGFSLLSYIIFLTTNILNGSLRQQIPLEQAARASQFIISLLSSYMIFIYALSSSYGLGVKFLLIMPFIFYFTYSGIWILKGIPESQVLLRTVVITLLMLVAVMVILVWPINIIYTILAASVIYYVLLNVALDYRTKLNLNYWVEYIVLICLISILLLTTANWGINGTII